MMTLLLLIIFIAFIGVGLPDSVLGTAWPLIYREFELPISLASYISATVSVGTILSSFLSACLINRFGTGMVTAVSTLLTAIALLGFSHTVHPVFFFVLAIPLGLGGGAVDTALNNFVALHYNASVMSFLHCFYGIGVAASPFVMSIALGKAGNWRNGYLTVAIIQFLITASCFVFLPLWNKVRKQDEEENGIVPKTLSFRELVRIPGVLLSCLAFCTACGLELTAGGWCSSYFVNTKGIAADRAATITMLFYIGMSLGRFLSGVFTKIGRRRILRISLGILTAAIVLFLLPTRTWISAIALFFIGLGIGPVYPNLVHLTPTFFGEDIAQSVMAIQQSLTYLGVMVLPWLFGTLAQLFSTALMPGYLLVLCALYALAFFTLMRSVTNASATKN